MSTEKNTSPGEILYEKAVDGDGHAPRFCDLTAPLRNAFERMACTHAERPQPATDDPLKQQTGGTHYKGMKIQPFEYIHANGIEFAEGSVIKYVSRWRNKNGLEDLKKSRHFLDLLISAEEKKAAK